MVSLTEVLELNWIILYFVYGQVFFVTGLVTGLQWRRHSDLELSRSLPWLAAFGVTHGLHEWGYIFIPLQALYVGDSVVRLMIIARILLLAVSFFCLLQYGVELVLPLVRRQRWLRAMPAAMLLLWAVAVLLRGTLAQDPFATLINIADALSRYLLCFPGAILSGVGLLRQAAQMRAMGLPRIGGYLTGAAIAFLAYAVVGGLLVPAAPTFLASLFDYSILDQTIRVPAPVLRSICGLAIAVFMVRSLDVFRVEADRRIAAMEQAQLLAADRERIGRDLHDGIIQKIYAAGLRLEDAQHLVSEDPTWAQARIRAVMDALGQTIQDIRRYVFDLRAAEQSYELETVLEDFIHDLRLDTLLEVDLDVAGQRCCTLDSQQMAHVTQIAREALSNVAQHADARHVAVSLSYLGDYTQLTVADDGKGVDLALLGGNGHRGQGILNIQARARLLEAELDLQSKPGQGFKLELTLPCKGRAEVKPSEFTSVTCAPAVELGCGGSEVKECGDGTEDSPC